MEQSAPAAVNDMMIIRLMGLVLLLGLASQLAIIWVDFAGTAAEMKANPVPQDLAPTLRAARLSLALLAPTLVLAIGTAAPMYRSLFPRAGRLISAVIGMIMTLVTCVTSAILVMILSDACPGYRLLRDWIAEFARQ